MKKRFGICVVLGLILVFSAAVFSAALPTVNGDNNQWGTVLNGYLEVAHDSGGNVKASHITSSMIVDATIAAADLASGSVNTTHIVDATIVAADLAADSVNASEVVGVSRLLFGACNVDLPQLSLIGGGVNNTIAVGNPPSSNCTISGAVLGDRVIAISRETLPANVSLTNANISAGGNLTLGFTYAGLNATSLDAGIFSFSYIVFVNATE